MSKTSLSDFRMWGVKTSAFLRSSLGSSVLLVGKGEKSDWAKQTLIAQRDGVKLSRKVRFYRIFRLVLVNLGGVKRR